MARESEIKVEVSIQDLKVEALGDIAIAAAARGIELDVLVGGKDDVRVDYEVRGDNVIQVLESVKEFELEVRSVTARWS